MCVISCLSNRHSSILKINSRIQNNLPPILMHKHGKIRKYSETSIHRFRRGSEKETMDPGKQ
jgi:hypothetical protein